MRTSSPGAINALSREKDPPVEGREHFCEEVTWSAVTVVLRPLRQLWEAAPGPCFCSCDTWGCRDSRKYKQRRCSPQLPPQDPSSLEVTCPLKCGSPATLMDLCLHCLGSWAPINKVFPHSKPQDKKERGCQPRSTRLLPSLGTSGTEVRHHALSADTPVNFSRFSSLV